MASSRPLLLFDVDGTLTKPRQSVSPELLDFLRDARKKADLAVVGGSDLSKITEQLGQLPELQNLFEYVFSENGLVGYHGDKQLPSESIAEQIGEDRLQDVINFVLGHFATTRLPVKRGVFVEYRRGMLNVSPIGRSCSQAERDGFVAFEAKNPVREPLVAELRSRFTDYGLTFSIGGQISVDIFPTGWDKTYCLRHLKDRYPVIHFFGDKTAPGGNDHEIFADPGTIGHSVTDPDDTKAQVTALLAQL